MSDYGYSIEIKLTVNTPEGSPQEITYRQAFLSNEELLREQAKLTPKVVEAVISHGLEEVKGRGRG